MKILNLGCGYNRLPDPFVNVDSLKAMFAVGTPERAQLDRIHNYVEADLRHGIPMPDNSCDGVLASHFIEHINAQEAWKFVAECYRVLMPGGVMVASVPDTAFFRKVHPIDTKERSGEIFGEQMDAGNPHTSFFDCALFFNEHLQLLTEDSLWAILHKGGFDTPSVSCPAESEVVTLLKGSLNRPKFSLVMWGVK